MIVECHWSALATAALHLNTCLTTQTLCRTRLMQLVLLGSAVLSALGILHALLGFEGHGPFEGTELALPAEKMEQSN